MNMPQRCGSLVVAGLLLLAAPARAQSAPDEAQAEQNRAPGAEAEATPQSAAPAASFVRPVAPVLRPREPWLMPGEKHGVDWAALLKQSALFLTVEHGFRFATEPGTRAGLRGPFLNGWVDAASNLHGWADGDEFYVNYIGHPMMGSVAGFIFTQNDRDYRAVEFGANRAYWKSRLRAAAWSWAFSEQFEIGPLSEASLGKIQGRYPQQGFVDHVITPAVGMGWLATEDALDRYVIARLEQRFRNPYVRLALRGTLNPTRSFANLMRFRVPWQRDDRPGVFEGERTLRLARNREQAYLMSQHRPALVGRFGVAPLEFSFGARQEYYLGGGHCVGGGAETAYRLSSDWVVMLDVRGCKFLDFDADSSGDALTYLVGPRWTPRAASRWSPFAEVLVGGTKISKERIDPELRQALLATALKPETVTHEQYATSTAANRFSMTLGGGLDYRFNPALALRLAALEYKHTWAAPLGGTDYSNNLSFGFSMIVRMGTW